MARLFAGIGRLWARGCLGTAAIVLGGLLVLCLCGAILGGCSASARPPTPTQAAEAIGVTAAPTRAPVATAPAPPEEAATEAPTAAPGATQAPVATATAVAPIVAPTALAPAAPTKENAAAQPGGVAPASIADCPPDYPVKGNNGKSGKIYHVPGSASYKATHPERCYATAADAEAAGYRAPRK